MVNSGLNLTWLDGDNPPLMGECESLELGEIIRRYAQGTTLLERRLLDLDDEQADAYFRPEAGVGRWSCRALVGHLADAELVQVHRMRRTVAEDQPVFALWDENAFLDAGLYTGAERPLAGFVATIHTLRVWTGEWLESLPESAWQRISLHPESGEQSLRSLLNKTTWHFEHHVWYLRRKLSRILGPPE